MSKREKLIDLIEQIQEIYPQFDGLIVTEDMIVISSVEKLTEVAEGFGMELEMSEDLDFDEEMGLIDWDGDDDEGGGYLQ